MEKITDSNNNDITVYINDIDLLLHEFFAKFMPEKLAADPVEIDKEILKASQSRFNAALMDIGKRLFSDRKKLKAAPYMKTPGTPITTNNNSYNYELLNDIADYYIYLCSVYEKQVSAYGYSYLTNINRNILYEWLADNDKYTVSRKGYEIAKKIQQANEQSLADILVTGKRNPVSTLGMLNHLFNWQAPGMPADRIKRQALPAEQLPKLESMGNMHNDSPAADNSENS